MLLFSQNKMTMAAINTGWAQRGIFNFAKNRSFYSARTKQDVYSGRMSTDSIAKFFKSALEASNWFVFLFKE